MDNDKEPSEELDKLSKAIIEAIFSSDKVKHALTELRNSDVKFDNSHMVLVLNMKGITQGEDAPLGHPAETSALKRKNLRYQIDGKELSKNEIQFYEHEADNFDENKWLKKIKVSFNKD